MPLLNVRGDVEQAALWLVRRQLADVTPHVSAYGPQGRPPQGHVRVRRIAGAGGLDDQFGTEQATLEVSSWAWADSPGTVNAKQLAVDLINTAQATLLLAQRNSLLTPFGSFTRWVERTAPFENREGTPPSGQTWMQATCSVTFIPPLTPQ